MTRQEEQPSGEVQIEVSKTKCSVSWKDGSIFHR